MHPLDANDLEIWTIGHSNRSISDFLGLLRSHRITVVLDVRRHAGSRAHPHFNPEPLAASLGAAGIRYEAVLELGGRRAARRGAPPTGWRNASFAAYAAHMESDEFRTGLHRVIEVARGERPALLCAEAVWWRCHRSLIADALKAGGAAVHHIVSPNRAAEHPYTAPALVRDGELSYPPPQPS